MSLYRYLWRAAVRRQPLIYASPCTKGHSLFLQPRSGGAPSIGSCWVQPLVTGSVLSQIRLEQKPREPQQAPALSAAEKVKKAGADLLYLLVALFGVGLTGSLLYVVFTDLLSSSSPNKLYGDAFETCRKHPEVIAAFGEPIKAYGESTKRGRRQHVASSEYLLNDVKCLRLKFYISGAEPRLQGVVHVDLQENPQSKKFKVQYILVEIDTIPHRTIIVEDNRLMS